MEPDASVDAGAGGSPSEAGASGDESELQIVILGNGTVAVSNAAACLSSPCSYPTSAGTTFALEAKTGADSRFVGWSGDCTGTKLSTSVAVSGVTVCTATFVVQRAVAAAVAGEGGGSVVSDPDLSCGPTGCSGEVDDNSTVTFTATPKAGFGFVEWTGSPECDGKTTPNITVKITKDLSCNATFAKQFKLTVSAAGATVQVGVLSGSCDALTCPANADASASFHATAPPAGFRFTGWSGDAVCTGTTNPLVVTHIASDITCVANYKARFTATGLVAAGLTGSVEASSANVDANCTGNVCTLDAGTTATLKAPTIAGSRLTGWSGAGCLVANQSGYGITITPTTANLTCTANYAAGVSVSGTVVGATGTVAAASTSAGASCTPGACGIDAGGSVALTAPNLLPTYRFSGWTGDAGCSGATLQITLSNVTSSKACSAVYVQQFTIASVANAGGTVSAKNGATPCAGNSCTVDFETPVTLTAVPNTASGYHFTVWAGAACTPAASPTLTLKNVNTTCTASFALDTFTIAAVAGTNGSVSATRGDTNAVCAGATCTVNYGVNVSLAGLPNTNYHFNGWTGASCTPTGNNPLALKNLSATCNATFALNTFAASVSAAPTAGGAVGLTCPGNNCGAVPSGQTVNVTAAANAGWSFAGWSANCGGGTASPKAVTITANTACVAAFRPTATAVISPSGSGTITATGTPNAVCASGNSANCVVDSGGSVTFVAKPVANAIFTGWTGDCTGTSTTATLSAIAAPKNCTASFYNLWAQASGTTGDETMTNVTTLGDGTVVGLGVNVPVGSKVQNLSLVTMDANTGKIQKSLTFTDPAGRFGFAALGLTTDSAQKAPVALAFHAGVRQPYLHNEANKWDSEYTYSGGGAMLNQGGEVINTLDGGYAFCLAIQDPPNAAGVPAIPAGHLTKVDSAGKALWDAQFCVRDPNKLNCFPTYPVDVLQDPETKNYAVLSQVTYTNTIVALTFISEAGDVLGSTYYGEQSNLVGAQFARGAAADTYLVVGSHVNADGGNAFYAELSRAAGVPRFAYEVGARSAAPRLLSVAKTASGYGLSGVYTDAKQSNEAWLVLLDTSGVIKTQLAYGGPLGDRANAISTAPAGGFVLGGATLNWGQVAPALSDMWTLRVDAAGAITFDAALSPQPIFQTATQAGTPLSTITPLALDTGKVKSTATQVKATVTSTPITFDQVKQTP
ncbi:MAG: hypothetical protein ABIQ16_08360 [Polyangiaceae bacterium]